MTPPKLLFLDIDGTLTENGNNIPPASALRAVRMAQENGHRVFLCTGRNLAMIRPLLRYGFDGYVASAGAYVVCGEKVIIDSPMSYDAFRLAMDCFERNHIFRTVECLNGTYTDVCTGGRSDTLAAYSTPEMLAFRRRLEESLAMRPMREYDGSTVYKIVFMCVDHSQLEEPIAVLSPHLAFCLQDADWLPCVNGEVSGKAFNKGHGIRAVSEYLGVDIADTVGFGDSMNDKEMFDTVGCSVCMGNGHPAMKERADYVCPCVSDDGLYKAFGMLGLI